MTIRILLWAFLALALTPGVAFAQAAKTFAVLPFAVHGPEKYRYLEQGIQSMLASRLTWPGKLEPLESAKIAKAAGMGDPASKAGEIIGFLGVDYLVYGSATILGDDASLDVTVADAAGKSFPQSGSMKLAELIPGLERYAAEINAEIFGRKTAAAVQPAQPQAPVSANPSIVYAESDDGRYVNPNIQYHGDASEGRWRSRSFDYKADDIRVGDVDGDGRNEVVVAASTGVFVYDMADGRMVEKGKFDLKWSTDVLALGLIDVDRDKRMEIVLSTYRDKTPRGFIYKFDGKSFTPLAENLNFFLNVVKPYPDYRPTLIGQRKGYNSLFNPDDVYYVDRMANGFELTRKLPVPEFGNVFNFCHLPSSEDGGYKILVIDHMERLRTYSSSGTLLATGDEDMNSSARGMEMIEQLLGMGKMKASENDPDYYYVPMGMVVADTNNDQTPELLAVRNLSVASQVFARYRSYSQGEVQSLVWDGVNMTLLWKTRRIKGSIAGYTLGDIDGDGFDELCVAVLANEGVLVNGKTRSLILAYDIDPREGVLPQNAAQ